MFLGEVGEIEKRQSAVLLLHLLRLLVVLAIARFEVESDRIAVRSNPSYLFLFRQRTGNAGMRHSFRRRLALLSQCRSRSQPQTCSHTGEKTTPVGTLGVFVYFAIHQSPYLIVRRVRRETTTSAR